MNGAYFNIVFIPVQVKNNYTNKYLFNFFLPSDYICMEYIYKIPLETPAKKNSRITLKNGKNIPSEKYQSWHKSALLHLITQKRPVNSLNYPCKIRLYFYHSDKRRRDCDNCASSILDLLQDANILKDDNWQIVRELSVHNFYNPEEAYCVIKISKLCTNEI